jgi:hypothetical protein
VPTVTTNAELEALLALPQPPAEIVLSPGQWDKVTVTIRYPERVSIIATDCVVLGLVVNGGGNLEWIGGEVRAPGGFDGAGATAYCVHGVNARDVYLRDATVTLGRIGIVWNSASEGLFVDRCLFTGQLADGIVLNGGAASIFHSTFNLDDVPGGIHQDCIQWFGANCRGPFIIFNNVAEVTGDVQGFGGLGPRPFGIPVFIKGNVIRTQAPRAVSVAREAGEARGNIIGYGSPSGNKANMVTSDVDNPRPPGVVLIACGNSALDFEARGDPLPAWSSPCPIGPTGLLLSCVTPGFAVRGVL